MWDLEFLSLSIITRHSSQMYVYDKEPLPITQYLARDES